MYMYIHEIYLGEQYSTNCTKWYVQNQDGHKNQSEGLVETANQRKHKETKTKIALYCVLGQQNTMNNVRHDILDIVECDLWIHVSIYCVLAQLHIHTVLGTIYRRLFDPNIQQLIVNQSLRYSHVVCVFIIST